MKIWFAADFLFSCHFCASSGSESFAVAGSPLSGARQKKSDFPSAAEARTKVQNSQSEFGSISDASVLQRFNLKLGKLLSVTLDVQVSSSTGYFGINCWEVT